MASISARLRRTAADCSIDAKVCRPSPRSASLSLGESAGRSATATATMSPEASRIGASPVIHTPNSSANTALTCGRLPASTCVSSSSTKISSPRCDFSPSSSSGSTPMTNRLSTWAWVVRNRVGGFASRTSRRIVSISL